MPSIKIVRSWDEDSFDIVVEDDGRSETFNANHDDHGWGGMQSLENLAKGIAVVLGVDYEEVDAEVGWDD